MAEKTYPCIHQTKLSIGKDAWEWCALFNARVEELHCEKCEYRTLPQKRLELPKQA
jgi:hypothetical protein